MAKCKICKTNIPDGVEYCDNCEDKKSKVLNESYLDSLLNSVKNTTPSLENVYKKKSKANSSDEDSDNQQLVQDNLEQLRDIDKLHSSESVSADQIDNDWQDYAAYSVDLSDIEDFDKYDLEDDLSNFETEDYVSDKELFGQDLSELIYNYGNNEEAVSEAEVRIPISAAELLHEVIEPDIVQESIADEALEESFYDSKDLSELIHGALENPKEQELFEDFTDSPVEQYYNEQPGIDVSQLEDDGQVSLNEDMFEQDQSLTDVPAFDSNQRIGDIAEAENSQIYTENTDSDDKKISTDFPGNSVDELEREINETVRSQGQEDIPESLSNYSQEGMPESLSSQRLEDTPDIIEEEIAEEFSTLEEEDFDPDLNDLLDQFNTIPEDYRSKAEKGTDDHKEEKLNEDGVNVNASEDMDQLETDEDEFLNLLSQMSADDPVSEDVRAINDLLQGKTPEAPMNGSMPSDVGEVFSDALKGISSLTDLDVNEEELLNQIPDKKGKKAKKDKKEKKLKQNAEVDGEKPKKGVLQILQALFGNVKKEKKSAKTEGLDITAEEPTAPQKQSKKSKNKEKPDAEDGAVAKKARKGKKAAAAEGVEESGKAKAAKKEKKEKKKKSKEIIQVIDDIEEDEGSINRLGATIVFLFFGLLVTLILVGTNTVSYTLSIEKATDYFDNREYTDAYNEVYGMEIKDEDFAIYNKIMTVMYVNKQLNSYNNYYSIGQYPQALDSLLKGLRRYDKYIELATMLGIDNDLKYVRKQILAELKNEFNLSQKQAMKIISYDNMETYSLAVYDIVDKNISN